jgi:AraC-like DNA-binding protein
MRFRESPPSQDLAPLVRSHWEFVVAAPAGAAGVPARHEVFPDGYVSISYGRHPRVPGARLGVLGPRLDVFTVPVWGGHVFRGVKLAPAATNAVLGCGPGELRGLVLDLADVAPGLAAELVDALDPCETFEAAIGVFEAVLRGLLPRASLIDPVAGAAAAIIVDAGGSVPISEVASRVGLGVRQLERRFRAAVGLTPKEFARVRRIRAAARLLVADDDATWADRAAKAGFADQAHLTREFGSTTGDSPRRFEKRVRAIEHGDLVD